MLSNQIEDLQQQIQVLIMRLQYQGQPLPPIPRQYPQFPMPNYQNPPLEQIPPPLSSKDMRSFNDWWKTVPADLQQKTRKGDEQNKPLLNQVNYALLHLHLAGKHDAKPSHEELKNWLHSGQVDVLRMNK